MKIGFFGGSFDPPHCGHIGVARLAANRLGLERVLFAPVGVQPLKRDRPQARFADRVAMTALAIAGEPGFELSLIDAPRADGRPNYTMDTIRTLREKVPQSASIYCLMGADSFLTIGKWHRAAELLLSSDFVVASRPGFDLGRIAGALPPTISVASCEQPPSGELTLCLRNGTRESHLYLLPDLAEEASASDIRTALKRGAAPQTVLPPTVAEYIAAHRLYLGAVSS